MALVTENGTGQTTAESLISVAAADTYFSNRGNATWAALTTAQKESALRKASDYMLATYKDMWAGNPMTQTQALDWPRDMVPKRTAMTTTTSYWDNASVPTIVANAAAELAVRASADDLLADQARTTKRETVGPITIEYDGGSSQTVRYPIIDGMLKQFFKGKNLGSYSMEAVRA